MSDDKKRENAEALYQAVSLGLLFPIAIAVGYFLGHWLDRLFGCSPWLSIICTALGIAAAFLNLFRAGTGSDGTISGQ